MLKRGFLAGIAFYACTKHTDQVLEQYENNLNSILEKIKNCEKNKDIDM